MEVGIEGVFTFTVFLILFSFPFFGLLNLIVVLIVVSMEGTSSYEGCRSALTNFVLAFDFG